MIPTFARREVGRFVRPGTAALIAPALVLALFFSAPVAVESVPASLTVTPAPTMTTDPTTTIATRFETATPFPSASGIVERWREFAAVRNAALDAARAHLGRPTAAVEVPIPEPKAEPKAPPGKIRARGDATWYCVAGVSACHRDYGGGLYAAAGSELRVGDWRGRTVTVCGGGACIPVTLVDWCACEGDRVIDLYGDAFRRLAPLGEGVLGVTVRW